MKINCYVTSENGTYNRLEIEEGARLYDVEKLSGQYKAICALMDGSIVPLTDAPKDGSKIKFLSADKSLPASRVFLRGATFLLYCAAKSLFPDKKLVIDHALYGGIYCRLEGAGEKEIMELEQKIYGYIAEDADFNFIELHLNEAKKLLNEEGLTEKARLLAYRSYDHFKLYSFDGRINYFYGVMPKSASYLDGAKLRPYHEGFILKYPTPYMEASTSIADQPKYQKVFDQAEKWADILSVSYISDINDMLKKGKIEDFIGVNEALHEQTISELAQRINEYADVRLILIAGPSSSGKTTFASRLSIHLRATGRKCVPISIDDYYKDRKDIPHDSYGNADLESLEAIDLEKLNGDLKKLLSGETAYLPSFDFSSGSRRKEAVPLRIDGNLLIMEGIHGLNNALTGGVPDNNKYKIYVSPLTTLNFDEHSAVFPDDLRLIRRLVRDKMSRGYSFEQTFSIWDSVRRGEYKYILPYQETADAMFNSTLIYEPLVLKKHCYGELRSFTPNTPFYTEAKSLLKFLKYFQSYENENAIPVNSILREFIGPLKPI